MGRRELLSHIADEREEEGRTLVGLEREATVNVGHSASGCTFHQDGDTRDGLLVAAVYNSASGLEVLRDSGHRHDQSGEQEPKPITDRFAAHDLLVCLFYRGVIGNASSDDAKLYTFVCSR